MDISQFEIVKKSKYTVAAMRNGEEVATAKSRPKLLIKLKEKFGKKRSIRSRVIELMNKGKLNAEITKTVMGEYPESAYNSKHTCWYRNNLVKTGVIDEKFAAGR